MPAPMPLPTWIHTYERARRAAPTRPSATADAWVTLLTTTGAPSSSAKVARSGKSCQPRLGASTHAPVS